MYLMWECRLTLLQAVAFLQCNMALKITPRLCVRPRIWLTERRASCCDCIALARVDIIHLFCML
jgi:hypothetical protein